MIFKKIKKKDQLSEDRELFIKVYKMFLETLISIFYPVRLEWYEFLAMVVLGVLFGIGIGRIVKGLIQ
ncbi:MAG: hypothetical protein QXX12_03030 [Nanopusillaceae archaeon]